MVPEPVYPLSQTLHPTVYAPPDGLTQADCVQFDIVLAQAVASAAVLLQVAAVADSSALNQSLVHTEQSWMLWEEVATPEYHLQSVTLLAMAVPHAELASCLAPTVPDPQLKQALQVAAPSLQPMQ